LKLARIYGCDVLLVFGGMFFCQMLAQDQVNPRVLAPGVLKTIKPDIQILETRDDHVDPVDIVSKVVENDPQILDVLGKRDVFEVLREDQKKYDWSKEFPEDTQRFLYDDNAKEKLHNKYEKNTPITCLQFQFKTPRFIVADLPSKEGKIVKTPVLYMVYNVTNKKWSEETLDILKQNSASSAFHVTTEDIEKLKLSQLGKEGNKPDLGIDFGSSFKAEEKKDSPAVYEIVPVDTEFSFTPQFVLATEQIPFSKKNNYSTQYYKLDQIIPLAVPKIIEQEDPNREFETTVTMSDKKIAPGETVWGIAMWSNINPEIKNFSIFISGLSNAYRWTYDESTPPQSPVGTGYTMTRKTLQLNFWVPGSPEHLLRREIQFDTKAPVDHKWVYR
jgi:hypothetical protein